jgi:hypothetical protein
MRNIGPRIKIIHRKVGMYYSNPDASERGYCVLKPIMSQTAGTQLPVRKFNAHFDYDTESETGHIITMEDGRKLLMTSKKPSEFRNYITEYFCELFETNATVTIKRAMHTKDETTGQITTSWTTIATGENAVIVDYGVGSKILYQTYADIAGINLMMLVASSNGVTLKDRIEIAGDANKYEVVEKPAYSISNVDVCRLKLEGKE